jgi:hypothetical protein
LKVLMRLFDDVGGNCLNVIGATVSGFLPDTVGEGSDPQPNCGYVTNEVWLVERSTGFGDWRSVVDIDRCCCSRYSTPHQEPRPLILNWEREVPGARML